MSALPATGSRKTAGPLLAIGEWLMILPATFFLAAALVRQLQPAQFLPAHRAWMIVNWAVSHVSHFDAAVIFLVLPAIVLLCGWIALLLAWRADESFRRDLYESVGILRRNLAACVVAAATALGGAILAAAIVHLILG